MGGKKKKEAKTEETSTPKSKSKIRLNRKYFFGALTVFLLPLFFILFLVLFLFTTQRIYPNISVAGIDIGLLTREEAIQKVAVTLSKRGAQPLNLELSNPNLSAQQSFTIDLAKQETAPYAEKAITEAFTYGRTQTYFPSANIDLKISPSIPIKNQVENIAANINQNPIDSSLKIYEGEITVTPSQSGVVLDEEKLYAMLNDYVNGKTLSNTNLPIKTAEPKLTFQEASAIKKRLDEIKLSPIRMTFEDLSFTLDLEKILNLIDLDNSRNSVVLATLNNEKYNIGSVRINGEEISDSKLTLNQAKLDEYLKTISSQTDRPVQEPLFSVDPNSAPEKPRITEFRPPLDGRELDREKTAALISVALIKEGQNNITLPVNIIPPKNSLVNDLGIKELIGRGVSNFAGSIENRKFNVGLAASRINGVIIPPNEEFSFVNTVGDISGATGYKQAYVIKSGRTVLDDGGGVCQVSTTIFRSALNTGLPITARTAHAYRVGYYEQGFPPGIDATIFHPSVDFKFKNDTGHHILIQAYVTGTTLTVDLYGTSDGRTVSMTKPVISSVTPAPPELRQDDPTLPKGTVKQVDFAANGANVSFKRTVTKGGVTYIDETFRSNYRPWQAVFLVGTKEG